MEVGILLLVAVLLPLLLTRSPTDDEYEIMKVDWGDPIENLDDGPYDNHPAYLALAKHECKDEGHVGDYRGPPSYPNDVYDTRTNQYLYDMSKW
jgi:hypothetical protein